MYSFDTSIALRTGQLAGSHAAIDRRASERHPNDSLRLCDFVHVPPRRHCIPLLRALLNSGIPTFWSTVWVINSIARVIKF